MRIALIIVLTLILWSGSVSLRIKPQTINPDPTPSPCLNTRNGGPLLQTMSKGTILGIHDNGRELIVGIPGNWADFPLEDQKTTLQQIHCYAKELKRQLQFRETASPKDWLYDLSSDK